MKEENKKVFFSDELLVLKENKWTKIFAVLQQNELIVLRNKSLLQYNQH